MVPGIAAIQDVLKVFFEIEVGVNGKFLEISLDDVLLVSRHTVLGWVLFFWQVWTWRI